MSLIDCSFLYLDPSFEVASVYFVYQLSLYLVQCQVTRFECVSKLFELLALREIVLAEALLVCLEFASCSSFSEQVLIAVLNLNSWLASIVVEDVSPAG